MAPWCLPSDCPETIEVRPLPVARHPCARRGTVARRGLLYPEVDLVGVLADNLRIEIYNKRFSIVYHALPST